VSGLARLQPRRLARSASKRARGFAMRIGVIPYAQADTATLQDWNSEYASGEIDHYADLDQLGRYSVLIGYVRFLGDRPSILDFGCGVGLLRERLGDVAVGRYRGIDPAREAIKRATRLQDERTSFLVAEVPPADKSFDEVVCNEVLYVVPDAAATLAIVHGVLRQHGHLLTSNWHHPGDQALDRLISQRFELVDGVDVRTSRGGRPGSCVAIWRPRP
jgi:2-polyprenyl-6-hydroxyphenyl methylase/3-demethylubiquinone-9 3-methyltransferase